MRSLYDSSQSALWVLGPGLHGLDLSWTWLVREAAVCWFRKHRPGIVSSMWSSSAGAWHSLMSHDGYKGPRRNVQVGKTSRRPDLEVTCPSFYNVLLVKARSGETDSTSPGETAWWPCWSLIRWLGQDLDTGLSLHSHSLLISRPPLNHPHVFHIFTLSLCPF